jgi:surface antigen
MGRVWIVAGAIVFLPLAALGQTGWGRILKGSAFAEFRDGDWEMFRQSLLGAADDPADGNVTTWSNAKTGAQGNVSAAKRYESPKLGECRKLQGETSARGRAGPFTLTFCRQAGGTWRLI